MFGDPVYNTMDWPTKPIKDIAPESNACIPEENEYWWLNLDMIESYSGMLVDKVIEKADAIGNSTHAFDSSMVLYSKLRPYLNKAIVPDGYGYATTELVCLKPNPVELNKYFLFNLLRGDCFLNFATKCSSGAQMPRMPMRVLREFPCILPPMELQNKFVEFAEQSDKSKFYGKSQFIEMFGLPEHNVHGFETGKISDVVKDVHYGTAKKASENGKYIYIRMNNITYEGNLDLSDIKHIDVSEKELAGCMVQQGDVLFNRTNSKDLVGKTCYFSGNEPMIIAGYIIRLRMNGKVVPEYLSIFMNLDRSKKLLYNMAKGAVGQANINSKEVQSIEIVIPPEGIQRSFLLLLKQSDKSKLSSIGYMF